MTEPTFQLQVDRLLSGLKRFDILAWDASLMTPEDLDDLQDLSELSRRLAADLEVLSHLCHYWGRATVEFVAATSIEHVLAHDVEAFDE